MNKNDLKIAVLGCGAWGMNHVRVWHELGCLQIVSDLNRTSLEQVKARFPEVETCSDLELVLANREISAVVIATPAPTHKALALKALEAGKDVLVEKPMALTGAEGLRLVETARNRGRILQVGHVLEYHPVIRKLKEMVSEGSLGRLQYIYSTRLNLGKIRTEENALWSFAPHDIAILLRLLEATPDDVTCHGQGYLNHSVADATLTNLRFRSGVQAHIFVSWLHPFKEHRFVVVGEQQTAVFDDTCPWGNKLVLYPHRVNWLNGQVPVAHRAEAIPVPVEEGEPLRAECEDFVQSILTRRQPLTNGESGFQVLRVLEAAQRSLEQGSHPVHLNGDSANGARPSSAAPPHVSYQAHPTATVDTGAEIGEGTRIWHYSHVMSGAKIGYNCILGQNVFVGATARIGNGVKIQNNVSVYDDVELEDYVFCGPSMVFTNVMNPRSHIERKHEFRKTLVKRGATLGANCTIVCGNTIGRYAFVGAGSVVTKDVPDYALVMGVPARVTGWVCECGEKLTFSENRATCIGCGERYRQPGRDKMERETAAWNL